MSDMRSRFPFGLFLFFLLLLVPIAAFSNDLAGRDLLIPIAGRAPGAFGSEWRTDVVVTNLGTNETTVGLTLRNGSLVGLANAQLRPGQTKVWKDVMLSEFKLAAAHGWIEVTTNNLDAKLAAHARIYNIANASGEFGQIVPAFPVVTLGKEASLASLSGVSRNRTNIGIANPSAFAVALVSLTLLDQNGDVRATTSLEVPRVSVVQTDVFSLFNVASFDQASVRLTSSIPMYAYASVVRNDSGDADFIAGAAPDRAITDVIAPSCTQPASLELQPNGAGGYIVVLRPGTPLNATVAAMESKYGFKAINVYQSLEAFFADLSPEMIAGLRCEPAVLYVSQNGWAQGGAH